MTPSKQPRKQRRQAAEAPLHQANRELQVTLSDELREEHGTRRVRVAEGDTVEVMRGDFRGHEADVVDVDLRTQRVVVEEAVVEKTDGEEVPSPIDPSNLRVVDLNLEDERRIDRLRRKGGEA
ncbi:MAG: 50S ribosomal protein L24 [Halobacteriota archaeon]